MFNTSKTKSLLLVAVVVLAMAGGALAAAPTVNTETTDTTYTTELNDGDTQTYNDSTSSLISWSADSENSSIEIAHDGDTVYEASPDVEDSASGTHYYNATVADDGSDYDGLEIGAGENVTLNVTLTNDTEADDPDTTNISYTYEHTDESAWIASESPESEDTSSGLFGGFSTSELMFWSSSSDDSEDVGTTLSTDSTTITENTSEVKLDTLNSNMSDAFAASTSDASDGDLIWSSYSQVSVDDGDAQYVPVFYQSASDDTEWLNTSEDAYATITEDGETMTVHNPNALLDDGQTSGTLDVTAVGDEALGFQNAQSMLSADMYDTSGTDAFFTALGAGIDYNGNPEFVTESLA